jgi:hypothetical protein
MRGRELCDFFRQRCAKQGVDGVPKTTSGGKQGVAHDRCARLTDEKRDKGVADLAGSPRHRHNELPLIGSMRRHVAITKNVRRNQKTDLTSQPYCTMLAKGHHVPFPLSSEALGCLVSLSTANFTFHTLCCWSTNSNTCTARTRTALAVHVEAHEDSHVELVTVAVS